MQDTVIAMIIGNYQSLTKGGGPLIADVSAFPMFESATLEKKRIDRVSKIQPDLILLDLNSNNIRGSASPHNNKQDVHASCIIMNVSGQEQNLFELLASDNDVSALNDMEGEELHSNLVIASEKVSILQDYLTHALTKTQVAADSKPSIANKGLTDRENEILECLAEGMNNKNIARKLDISYTTVKVHIKNILRKLNLKSRLEAAVWIHQHKQKT